MGRAQARRLGERLQPLAVTAIVASDLERAAETAQIIARACGVPVELDRGLREIDVGLWSGKSYDEVASLYPDEWSAAEAGVDVRRGGGETCAELAERVDAAIRGIVSRHGEGPDRRVLVVSHGGAIKSWMTKTFGGGDRRPPTYGAVSNTGLTILEHAPPTFRVQTWNDVAHLDHLVAEEATPRDEGEPFGSP